MLDDPGFLCAIGDNPSDDAPRLIYADYLEERGQAERADFIRTQCALASLTPPRPVMHVHYPEIAPYGMVPVYWDGLDNSPIDYTARSPATLTGYITEDEWRRCNDNGVREDSLITVKWKDINDRYISTFHGLLSSTTLYPRMSSALNPVIRVEVRVYPLTEREAADQKEYDRLLQHTTALLQAPSPGCPNKIKWTPDSVLHVTGWRATEENKGQAISSAAWDFRRGFIHQITSHYNLWHKYGPRVVRDVPTLEHLIVGSVDYGDLLAYAIPYAYMDYYQEASDIVNNDPHLKMLSRKKRLQLTLSKALLTWAREQNKESTYADQRS